MPHRFCVSEIEAYMRAQPLARWHVLCHTASTEAPICRPRAALVVLHKNLSTSCNVSRQRCSPVRPQRDRTSAFLPAHTPGDGEGKLNWRQGARWERREEAEEGGLAPRAEGARAESAQARHAQAGVCLVRHEAVVARYASTCRRRPCRLSVAPENLAIRVMRSELPASRGGIVTRRL